MGSMAENLKNNESEIRKYLLGLSERGEQIEEALFTDSEFLERLLIVEDEIIQDFADGKLSEREEKAFRENFLVTEERRENLRFSKALKQELESCEPEERTRESAPEQIREKRVARENGRHADENRSLKNLFSFPYAWGAVFGVLVLMLGGLFLFRSFDAPAAEDAEAALASLQKAFSAERPFEPRLAEFEYAPPSPLMRGGGRGEKGNGGGEKTENNAEKPGAKINRIALDRARNLSQKAASEEETFQNLYALGKTYLAEKKFDQAIELFERALPMPASDAEKARLENDLGVAFLAKSKTLDEDSGREKLELNARALEKFESASRLDENLLDARFNRALALEEYTTRQAIKAWKEYLALDPNSDWAAEARANLKKLEAADQPPRSSADLENEFSKLARAGKKDEAWALVSGSRELITLRYLPQKLAMTFVSEPASADSKKKAKI